VNSAGVSNRHFHPLVKTPNKHCKISEVTILSHNIVVNPKPRY